MAQVTHIPFHPHQPTPVGMQELGASHIPPQKTWVLSTSQHPMHTKNQDDWGERTTHQKRRTDEKITWYNQH